MTLTDIMSASGLAWYPTVALILFLLAFIVLTVRLMTLEPGTVEHLRELPLDSEPADSQTTVPTRRR